MLVVASNWCVSDGSLAGGMPRAWIERFRAEVRRASLRCGVRRDGRYDPVDAIDVVLAGDTFDWLVSREWTGDLRPWHVGRRADAARERVVNNAARRGERLLATLSSWLRNGNAVPVADRRGRPVPEVSRHVPVRVSVLRGDRDRWLEQAAHAWTRSRPGSPAVGHCWSDGVVTVRHGDEMDPLHAGSGSDPSLGESLAVDLIARFGVALHDIAAIRPLAGGITRRLASRSAVDASRKLLTWLEDLDAVTGCGESTMERIRDVWNRSVFHWHRSTRRLVFPVGNGVDMADRIAVWLHLENVPKTRETSSWSDTSASPSATLPWAPTAHLVLGHGGVDHGAKTVCRRHVICLGDGASRAAGRHEDDMESPAAVVVRSDGDGRRFEWLPIEAGPGGVDRTGEDTPGHGVWRSTPSWPGGVVDAA